jgi:dTDP-4-amino-4,6-dideoxygalactose transaminase
LTDRQIPLVNLGWQHAEIVDEVRAGWDQVLEDTSFILGDPVHKFEGEFASFTGTAHCVSVANGTDALELALRAAKIEPRDEVVLPANTFIATALAVSRMGATPVLADCDPVSYLVSPESLEPVVTKRTKAIIPVHLYGQMAPVHEIREAFPELLVVEDGAQSQGATRHTSGSGSVGHVGATSFYPGKNIGAYGDAGAVVTDDPELAENVRQLRNWGSDVKYHHPVKGFNSRTDTLQAVVLSAKLRRLHEWNRQRDEAAAYYSQLLSDTAVALPGVLEGNTHVWHLYVVRISERDQVLARLQERGIGAGIHYPIPIHLQGAYSELGLGAGSFPVTEQLSNEALSLPMYPGLTRSDQEYVADALRSAISS